ncbi:MAG: recombinase family protein [Oscillospiraceae bacterium]|nr:recombinase family protein [Oscillospiraceae bacterium]
MEITKESGKIYGYARVSTKEQKTDRQLDALLEYGIPRKQILTDQISGKTFERPAWQKLLRTIRPGDTLVVVSIDRIGRDYDEIQVQWKHITRDLKANIAVLDMPLLDTRQGRDLTGTLIADLVLQILSYVAQTEREMIRKRQREGIDAALSRGVRFGRRPKAPPEHFSEICRQWHDGAFNSVEAARRTGVCQKTFLRWAREV